MKIDGIDILFNSYEKELKSLFDVVNVKLEKGTTEYKETYAAYKYLYLQIESISVFIDSVYWKMKKEGVLKQRHIKKYANLQQLKYTLNQCIKINFKQAS